jgi:hypothetical protein
MNINKLLISICCVVLMACSTAPVMHEASTVIAIPVPVPAQINESDDLMVYYQRARLLPQGDLPKMLAELTTLTKTPHREVQRAILSGVMRGNGDLARAQAILDGVTKASDAEAEHVKPLAYFLITTFAEWRRLDEMIEKQNQQLKEAQRRFDQLSQKLEDLKAIERQLPTRPRSSAPTPTASDNNSERK